MNRREFEATLTLIASVLSFMPGQANADMYSAWQRAQRACLSTASLARYNPSFTEISMVNRSSSFRTWIQRARTYVDLPNSSSVEAFGIFQEMRTSVSRYGDTHDLNDYQRACVAQCVSAYYFDNTRTGESDTRFEQASGMCAESTELAVALSESSGLTARKLSNDLWAVAVGSAHAYTAVRLDGRDFILNNNWRGDICQFHFSGDWSRHQRRRSLASGGDASVTYLSEWDRQAALRRAAGQRERRERERRQLIPEYHAGGGRRF